MNTNAIHLSVTEHLQPSVSIEDRVVLELVNYDHYEEKLREVPYYRIEDMAVVFACLLDGPLSVIDVSRNRNERVLVNDRDLRQWGIGKEELYAAALRNTAAIMPAKIASVASVLGLSGAEAGEGEFPELYMISNEQGQYGAATLLYPGMLRQIAERFHASFFLIPSSVHELLLLPGWSQEDGGNLCQTVHDVNEEEVAPEEILSYNVYYYDMAKDRLDVLGRKPVHPVALDIPTGGESAAKVN